MAIFDVERATNLYNADAYESNTSNWEDSASVFRAKAFYEAMSKGGVTDQVTSILDVGCGSGGVLMKLSKGYGNKIGNGLARYDGIDLSANAIGVANRLYPRASDHAVYFSVGLINDENVNDKYSIVSLIHVLEHCPDMLEMLGACEKKADYLYINVPIEVNLLYTLRRTVLVNQYLSYGHLHFFNEKFFLCWLEKNGFEVLSTVYSPDFEVPKSGASYQMARWLRRWIGIGVGPAIATWLLGGNSFGVLVRSREV
jgi:SAM-dependent methyltransferase